MACEVAARPNSSTGKDLGGDGNIPFDQFDRVAEIEFNML